MTFRSWGSHVIKPSKDDLTWPRCPDLSELGLTPTVLQRHMNRILTQWDFHRVQEHPKRSSDEGVMTFQSWRSYVVTPSRANLTWPRCSDMSELGLTPTILHRHTNGILTQWAHRVQEHHKRSSDEGVMTFRSWRSHVVTPSRADLTWTRCPDLSEIVLTPTVFHRHRNGILTQWVFHRVQEHQKWSSGEGVMTFRSWRLHVVTPSRAYLTWSRFPDLFELS